MALDEKRLEEILNALESIKTKLPSGDLESIKISIDSFRSDQKIIKEDLEYFKKRLFNPDDGIIVKVNKNTDLLNQFNDELEEIPDLINRIETLERWKASVNKASWFIFTTIGGLVAALLTSLFQGIKLLK
jgi:hypothetical protein